MPKPPPSVEVLSLDLGGGVEETELDIWASFKEKDFPAYMLDKYNVKVHGRMQCPFHGGSSESMTVGKTSAYCFSPNCRRSYDIHDFVELNGDDLRELEDAKRQSYNNASASRPQKDCALRLIKYYLEQRRGGFLEYNTYLDQLAEEMGF